jgi:ABC-2 type transport system permease protein
MMPDFMQVISKMSPMNWGIEGFYNILVRNLPLKDSLDEMMLLLLFFVITMTVSVIIYSYRRKRSI